MLTRRTFLTSSLAASALALGGISCATTGEASPGATRRRNLRILILGGTGFIGPALVGAARRRGHVLTLFNRGKTNPGLFADLEQLRGDRDGKLDALRGRTWDVVIDGAGYVPRVVRQSAELLRQAVGRYVFVSTISVYADEKTPGQDESAPRQSLSAGEAASEDVSKHYGALKAGCEDVVTALYDGRSLVARPGLIVGPGDPTDRFTYWPVRADRGGNILAPGDGDDPVQFIDVRDLANWIIDCAERDESGVYHAVGPGRRLSMRTLLEACRQAAGTPSTLEWVPATFLDKNGVSPWSDLPAWAGSDGIVQLSPARAVARGLTFRPHLDTARDTLAWWRTLPAPRRDKLRAGITAERERALLEAYRRER